MYKSILEWLSGRKKCISIKNSRHGYKRIPTLRESFWMSSKYSFYSVTQRDAWRWEKDPTSVPLDLISVCFSLDTPIIVYQLILTGV